MTPEEFAEGIDRIGLATRQPADAATKLVYFDALQDKASAEEWAAFARWVVDTDRFPVYFPKKAEISDALREFRGQRPLLVEATDAYERVLAAGIYTPEGGTTWSFRAIRETCGDAAAEAFLAAGGNAAFSTTWDEAKRRERFAAAYAEAVREEPRAGLLPAGEAVRLLPPVQDLPTRAEAVTVIRRLQDIAEVDPAPPKTSVVVATDERLELLRRQAQEIGAAAEPAAETEA